MGKYISKFGNAELPNRIELRLVREIPELMSSWHLAALINSISSSYYKIEILDSLSQAINRETPLEDIFVLDESFRLDSSLKKIRSLSLKTKQLNKIYRIGCPIGLFPDEDLFVVNLIFKLYRDINKLFSNIKCGRLKIEGISKAYNSFKANDFPHSIENLIEAALGHLSDKLFPEIDSESMTEEEKEKRKLLFESNTNNLQASKASTVAEYERFIQIKEEGIFDTLSDCIKNNKRVALSSEQAERFNAGEILDKYYRPFFKKLNRLSRPVVGIYDRDRDLVEIVCTEIIDASQRSDAFLDIKNISHDSPLEITLCALISLGALIYKNALETEHQKKLNKLEIDHIEALHSLELEHQLRKEVIKGVSSGMIRGQLESSYAVLIRKACVNIVMNRLNVQEAQSIDISV